MQVCLTVLYRRKRKFDSKIALMISKRLSII